MHYQAAGSAEVVSYEFFLGIGRMNQQYIRFALLSHLHGLAGTDRNGLYLKAALFFEQRNENVQQPGILGAGGGCQDDGF